MDGLSVLCVFVGGGIGSLLRWSLGLALNPLFPQLPLGTLLANIVGSALMGCTLAVFLQFEALPPLARVAITAGFLGGMTTFSTYSGEASLMLLRGEYRWAALHITTHVVASLSATLGALHATRAVLRMAGGAQ